MDQSNITIPFLKTILNTKVSVHPSQLNNDIYNNIYENIKKKLLNKCYKDYGYINKIYEVLNISSGRIYQEDNDACVVYNVSFVCKIINPVENTIIMCKIIQNSQGWLLVGNTPEPINVVISHDRINNKIFSIDSSTGTIRTVAHVLEENDIVKVKILKTNFVDKETEIISIGYLEDMASVKEIEIYFDKIFDD